MYMSLHNLLLPFSGNLQFSLFQNLFSLLFCITHLFMKLCFTYTYSENQESMRDCHYL